MKAKVILAAFAGTVFIAAGLLAAILLNRADFPEYYALKEFFFEGDFDKFRADMFNWYKAAQREDGVMLAETEYYGTDILDDWKSGGVYKNVPEDGFWYFAVSPSYLEEIGLRPLDGSIDEAWDGVRLYLLSNTLNERAAEELKAFLTEDALKAAGYGGIENGFAQRHEIAFLEYAPDKYYTWRSETALPAFDDAPVFYVCTTENMTSFESESLIATGVDGYIKFKNENVLGRFKDEPLFKNYGLKFAKTSEIYK